jgi:hypothetical protein
MIEIIAAIVGIPAALFGAVEGILRLVAWLKDKRARRRIPEQYVVKRMHVKYLMTETYVEIIKLRLLRALSDLTEVALDRYPKTGESRTTKLQAITDFYSIPGTAVQRAENFVITFTKADTLTAFHDHAIVFGFIISRPLSEIHPFDNESATIYGPLPTEELVFEMHLPASRRFAAPPSIRVSSVDNVGTDKPLPSDQYGMELDRAFQNTEGSRLAEVLRLRFRPPPRAPQLCVRWSWEKKSA